MATSLIKIKVLAM